MMLAQATPNVIPMIGIGVFAMLLLAGLVALALFLAAWERTRPVGMTILGLMAAVAIGVAALVFARFQARRTFVTGEMNTASTSRLGQPPEYGVVLDQPAAVAATAGSRAARDQQRAEESPAAGSPAAGSPAADSTAADPESGSTEAEQPAKLPPAAATAAAPTSSAAHAPDQRAPLAAATAPSTPKSAPPPDWVRQPPGRSGAVFRRVLTSQLFTTDDECYRQLDGRMLVVACRYLADRVGNHWQQGLEETTDERTQFALARHRLGSLGIDAAYLWQNACKEKEYREFIASSVNDVGDSQLGPMRRIHALLEFDEPVQRLLVRRWEDRERVERLELAGICAAGVLGLIGVVFVYLKVDTATKGFYSRRLKAAAVLATIFIIVVFLGLVTP